MPLLLKLFTVLLLDSLVGISACITESNDCFGNALVRFFCFMDFLGSLVYHGSGKVAFLKLLLTGDVCN